MNGPILHPIFYHLFRLVKKKYQKCNVKSSKIYKVKLALTVHVLFTKKSKTLCDQFSTLRKDSTNEEFSYFLFHLFITYMDCRAFHAASFGIFRFFQKTN